MRNKRILYSLLCCVMMTGQAHPQAVYDQFRAFGIQSYSGLVTFRGAYRQEEQTLKNEYENIDGQFYSGGILLNSSAYVLHPNFCQINAGIGYMPESVRDNYLVSPDFSEVRTVKQANILANFLNNKKVSFSTGANYDESFSRRESMTDIKTVNNNFNGSVRYGGRSLSMNLDFYKRKMDQTELETGRKFRYDDVLLSGTVQQSFSDHDNQFFNYAYRNFANVTETRHLIRNISNDINFRSKVDDVADGRVWFLTQISNFHQEGHLYLNYLKASEDFHFKLPLSFDLDLSGQYTNTKQGVEILSQYFNRTSLTHHLFNSLTSGIFYEYTGYDQTSYRGNTNRLGIQFNYTKQIRRGSINILYDFSRFRQNYETDSMNVSVSGEEHQLTDGKIVLLRFPYINENTIVIRDATGTVIYVKNVDYYLIPHGAYFEIRRIPSGMIPMDGTVFADYRVAQNGSYSYTSSNHTLGVNLVLFNGKVELYYKLGLQNYSHLTNAEFVSLNYFTQNIIGIKLNLNFINGGYEYESYNSSILPYNLMKYYLGIQKNFKENVILSLNGSRMHYYMPEEILYRVQQFTDVTGRVEVKVLKQMRVNLDLMYRNQQGREIDLNLLTGRLELNWVFFQLNLSAGFDVYRRIYVGDKLNFKGAFFQITRKF